MKTLIALSILFLSLPSFTQNMIYFERQNQYTDFDTGNGSVALQEVGLSSSMEILVKYTTLVGGNPTSTGWINHSGATYNDVYRDTVRAVGVYLGDTLIRTKHFFDANNYEIIDATASGFDNHGIYDLNSNSNWEIVITFDGPTSNSDAEINFSFFGGPTYSVNNILTLNQNIFPLPPVQQPVLFNNGKSLMTINSGNVNYPPNSLTNNTLLNAYIPRVNVRPNTINDCNGEITFERVQLINDVSLEYSINGSAFSPLTNDNFTGLCAYDTISVLGYSPTIMSNDTLVKTQYVLRSTDSLGQYDFDLAEVEISLNQNTTDPSGCSNTLTFTHFQGTSTQGYGILLNEFGEALTVQIDPNFNEYGNICQAQYYYSGVYFGNSPTPFISSNFSDYSSLTIVDENDSVHGLPVNTDIYQEFTDSLNCTSDLVIDRITSPAYSQSISYTDYVSNSPGTYEEDNTNIEGYYSQNMSISGLCPGIYAFNHDSRKKFVFVTDSMQQLDVNYEELIGDGVSESFMALPSIDSLKLYYEECTNDYSQPFNTVNYNKTNAEVSTVSFSNTGFNIEEFNSSFDLTQGSNSFYLHERPVAMMDYSSYPNPTPYYTIAELFCESTNKTIVKRRRIIIAPDGTITQEYEGNASISNPVKSNLRIYPNPASAVINIEGQYNWESYEVINSQGQLFLKGRKMGSENSINISALDKGIYLIRFTSKTGVLVKKIIVE